MNQLSINVQQCRSVRFRSDDMRIPNFVEQRLARHLRSCFVKGRPHYTEEPHSLDKVSVRLAPSRKTCYHHARESSALERITYCGVEPAVAGQLSSLDGNRSDRADVRPTTAGTYALRSMLCRRVTRCGGGSDLELWQSNRPGPMGTVLESIHQDPVATHGRAG